MSFKAFACAEQLWLPSTTSTLGASGVQLKTPLNSVDVWEVVAVVVELVVTDVVGVVVGEVVCDVVAVVV